MPALSRPKERGIVYIPILVAVISLIGFIVISQHADFKSKLFAILYPNKPKSYALEDISRVIIFPSDAVPPDYQAATQVSSRNVKLKLIYVAATPSSSPTPVDLPQCQSEINCLIRDPAPRSCSELDPAYGSLPHMCRTTSGRIACCQSPPSLPTYTTPTGIGSTASIGVGGSVQGVGTTAPQTANYPTHFRVANSVTELATATEQIFDMNGKVIDWVLTSGNGPKTVYVEFKVNNNLTTTVSATVRLEESSPSPASSANPITGQTQQIKVWMLSYNPTGQYDNLVGDNPAAYTKNTLLPAMNEASKYHGYANSNAQPALNYTLSDEDIKVENNPPPKIAGRYDYQELFNKYSLCNLAKQKDIKAVIVWAEGTGTYEGGMLESVVTSSNEVRTNRDNLLPYCPDKTIVVYGLNYTRGLAEALESYGHYLEKVFGQLRGEEYSSWADRDSCGSDHNPPNSRFEYDRSNTSSFQSDCRNFKADGTGTKESLTCNAWGCSGDGWLKWWMQNMPSDWWRLVANTDSRPSLVEQPTDVFSNLTAKLTENSAIFNFNYSGTSPRFTIDLSTAKYIVLNGTYLSFVGGSTKTLVESSPKKWDAYGCGKTFYWRVAARATSTRRGVESSWQEVKVECASPALSPIPSVSIVTTPSPSPTSTTVACTVCGADINKDGTVTILDFSRISACFNKRATDQAAGKVCTDADINQDGSITTLDQSCLSANFNKTCPEHQANPIPISAPTPSPSPTPIPTSSPSPSPTVRPIQRLTVLQQNNNPVITTGDSLSVKSRPWFTWFNIRATDQDKDRLTMTTTGVPSTRTPICFPRPGAINCWEVLRNPKKGDYPITVTVTDNKGGTATKQLLLRIQ